MAKTPEKPRKMRGSTGRAITQEQMRWNWKTALPSAFEQWLQLLVQFIHRDRAAHDLAVDVECRRGIHAQFLGAMGAHGFDAFKDFLVFEAGFERFLCETGPFGQRQ